MTILKKKCSCGGTVLAPAHPPASVAILNAIMPMILGFDTPEFFWMGDFKMVHCPDLDTLQKGGHTSALAQWASIFAYWMYGAIYIRTPGSLLVTLLQSNPFHG